MSLLGPELTQFLSVRDLASRSLKYGLTAEKLTELFQVQAGLCAVCSMHLTRSFHVDHDHLCCSGQDACGDCVRGLLCNNCNLGIGMLGDSYARVKKAADYLLKYENKRADVVTLFKKGLLA